MSVRLERLRVRATEHLRDEQWAPAAIRLEGWLQERPDDDAARLELAFALLRLDRVREARRELLRACEREPGNPALALSRLEALRAFAEHERMSRIGAAVDPAGLTPGDCLPGALALHAAGALASARRWYEQARLHAPDDARVRTNFAWLDLAEGRFATASAALEDVAARTPPMPLAHWLLARLRTQQPDAHHVERLRALLAAPGLAPHDEAPLAFALHKECDDLGWHDEAWAALERGCRARRAGHRHDADAADAAIDALIAGFGPMPPPEPAPRHGPAPIFIVGMHRAGTTLLERMLEGHPSVAAGGETQRLAALLHEATDHRPAGMVDAVTLARAGAIDAGEFAREYMRRHALLAGNRSHFTEKEPDNLRLVGLLRRVLPQARVLLMSRDPMDTCWSNLREMFAEGRHVHSYDQRDMARHYAGHLRLASHWRATCPGFVHAVSYERLVRDPERELRGVLSFCGLDWHARCLQVDREGGALHTASAVQARAPVHARSLRRWTPYAARLQPMQDVLARVVGTN